ncbi:MAG: hypothetical protein RBR59_00210 [Sulfurimonadaceae bacterium]|jgi:hypothetical protein|nr:hypothetical protein [Sulfurimonadaceae bacterium]
MLQYQSLFREIKKSKLLRLQAFAIFFTTYIDWTLMPFITKLEGTYLPVYMISFFMLIGALDGFIQPFFNRIKLHHIYLFAILLDIIQMISYFFYDFSVIGFTYLILTIFTIQGITFEIARIHTTDFMQEEAVSLKDYLMIRSLMISGAIVFGGLSAMIADALDIKLPSLLIYLSLIGIIALYFQYMLYRKFKKSNTIETVEIQTGKRKLFEKFRL